MKVILELKDKVLTLSVFDDNKKQILDIDKIKECATQACLKTLESLINENYSKVKKGV